MADECLSGRHSQKQAPTPEAVLKEIGSGESDESAKENRKEEQLPPVASREEEAPLEAASESGSAEARRRPVGDVVEVAQGPRREPPQETQRVKGKAAKDGKVGRVSLHDPQGSANLELTKPLIRKASVAITTTYDIGEGKAVRQPDAGEALEMPEESKEVSA